MNALAHDSAVATLNDQNVIENAQIFVNKTLNDGTVQEAAGRYFDRHRIDECRKCHLGGFYNSPDSLAISVKDRGNEARNSNRYRTGTTATTATTTEEDTQLRRNRRNFRSGRLLR